MGRPRKQNQHLPTRVFLRHGSYYYVLNGRWYNLGPSADCIDERIREIDPPPPTEHERLRAFLNKKITMLRSRPQSRTGRLKSVLITSKDMIDLAVRADWKCSVTGLPMTLEIVNGARPYSPSVDRIDPSKDYTIENCRVVCTITNLAMNVWGEQPLLRMAQGFTSKRFKVLDKLRIVGQEPL
jgi:hypothetical protein